LAERKFQKDRCRKTNNSYDKVAEAAKLNHLPIFSLDEIRWGNKLGNGAFGSVFEVKNISLETNSGTTNDLQNAARTFMAKHCLREDSCQTTVGTSDDQSIDSTSDDTTDDTKEKKMTTSLQSRYAIKKLRCKIVGGDQKLFMHAMIDMANETRLLASIPNHPNIIKLRGMATCTDGNESENESETQTFPSFCFHEHYGLVLDRLYGTLEDRLEDWVQELGSYQRNGRRGRKRFQFNPAASNTNCRFREEQLMSERLRACHDLASGLAHLHLHKIIHRDIKPSNIGFNIRRDLTLFDFGLSRELPETETKDSLWRLTGFVGSPRYMAPEVGLKRKYNAKCDVYSFGVLAWYIMTLQKPFQDCSITQLRKIVWPGDREIISPADWTKYSSWNSSFGNSSFGRLKRSLCDGLKSSTKKIHNKIHENSTTVVRSEFDDMIDRTFSRDIAARPTMKEFKDFLRNECQDHRRRCKKSRHKTRRKFLGQDNSELPEISEELETPSGEFNLAFPSIHESRLLSCRRRSTFVFEFEHNDRQSCFRRSLEDNTHHGGDLAQSSVSSGNNCIDEEESSTSSKKHSTEISSKSIEEETSSKSLEDEFLTGQ
jgi:serine/threonine protein kinase